MDKQQTDGNQQNPPPDEIAEEEEREALELLLKRLDTYTMGIAA
jgi:hypothetical protein